MMQKLYLLVVCNVMLAASAQQIYQMPTNVQSRVSSFENPNGIKGNGGKTNKTAKGNAFETIKKARQKR